MRQGESLASDGPFGNCAEAGGLGRLCSAFDLSFLLHPCPRQNWHEVLGFLWALLKG